MPARAARARPRWGVWLLLVLAAGLFALAALAGAFAYEYRYADRIYEGVRVAGIPLGGMSLEEATAAIAAGLTPYPGEPITLQYGERSWSLRPSDLGVSVDAGKTAAAAFAVGRRGEQAGSGLGGLAGDLASQSASLQFGRRVAPVLRYDDDALDRILQAMAREVDVPPTEGRLTISGLEVTGTPGYPGRRVDIDAARASLVQLLRAGKGGELKLVVVERPPAVVSVEAAAAKADALLSKALILASDGLEGKQRFAVDTATLRDWLTFSPVRSQTGEMALGVQLDREKVVSFLQNIAGYLDQPVRDAALDFDAEKGQVIVLSPSKAGQKLEVEAAADAITTALLGEGGGAAAAVQGEVDLPITTLEPKVPSDSNKIAGLGIVEEVSQGTTYFKGSTSPRVHNIVNAAEKFRGVVIPPGEEFSFNQHVGEISAANGFVDSLVIRGDRTELGVGGGVCQVSTTVFRAAFWGGFPIVERYAHAYVVGYYGEPGYDATIYTPTADFRFRNDTQHYLLIKPEVDTAKSRITFYLYGTKPARTVESGSDVKNVRKPPAPKYVENPDLGKGVIKPVERAVDGKDVYVTRTITYGGGKKASQKFVSKYQPWQAVYQYGPGTELPAGAAGG